MIRFHDVSFTYHSMEREDGVHHLNISIPSGQVVVLCGKSGCGKTTVTRLINGLVPEYYDGTLQGEVLLDELNISKTPLYEISKRIGSVFQNPRSQFFSVDTTGEIAFGCENMGLSKDDINQRIGQVATELDIWKLLDRNLFELSGGEKQKIACASVSAMLPDVLVLDEPSSNLDVAAIGELKKVIKHWKEQGKTIVIAEHRLYYLMDIADRILYMKQGEIIQDMKVEEFRKLSAEDLHTMGLRSLHPVQLAEIKATKFSQNKISLKDFEFSYGKNQVLDIPILKVPKGSVIGILGDNGAGKTTFAKCLCGLAKKAKGTIEMSGKVYSPKKRIKICYMVMQDVNHQLFTESVKEEIVLSLPCKQEFKEKKVEEALNNLNLIEYAEVHPMSLSGGQKQRVAIGSAIVSDKDIIVLDEPTSGLDYEHMLEVAQSMNELSEAGKTLFIITHDPELLVKCCNYFVFIQKGKVVWNGGWSEKNKEAILKFFAPAM